MIPKGLAYGENFLNMMLFTLPAGILSGFVWTVYAGWFLFRKQAVLRARSPR
jgi:hypothetical protein